MNKKIFGAVALSLVVSACGGKESYTSSAPWKDTDKHLTCEQLQLEMNDAQFWNTIARDNQKGGITDYIWPPGYIATRSSAGEALAATDQRLSHLRNVYTIKGCNKPYADTPIPSPIR